MLDQITPLILTYNEAANLERTMRQLTWANDIVVVDSLSEDETTNIAARFPQARIYERAFDSHRNQWTFGLTETNMRTPWVLALDADYVLSDELITELESLRPEPSVSAYTAKFTYCLNGKPLRSGIYPPVTVLYRVTNASYEQDGHTQRVRISGHVNSLSSKIFHDDRKPLRHWMRSQVKYAELEARKLFATEKEALSPSDRLRRWRVIAPIGVLFYCLILRGGIFDGWAGLFYAFQRSFAELMLSLYLIDATFHSKLRPEVLTGTAGVPACCVTNKGHDCNQQARTPAVPEQQARTAAVPEQQARTAAVPEQQARTPAVPEQQARTAAVPEQQARTPAVPEQQARTPALSDREARTAALPD